MATIVHAADLHVNSPLGGLRLHYPNEDWHIPTRQALNTLVAATIDASAAALVLAGDIVDRDWFNDHVARLLADSLRVLDESGVSVLVADGNHDAASRLRGRLVNTDGPLPPRVRWFGPDEASTEILDEIGVAIHGRGVPAPTAAEDLVTGFPPARPGLLNVGVLHTSLDRPPPVKPCAPTTTGALVRTGYHYWALGHMHRREVLGTEPWVVIAGNTQGRSIAETGPKGATIIETAGDRITAVRFRDVASIRWERIRLDPTVGEAADVAELAQARLRAAAADLATGQRLAARIELAGLAIPTGHHAELAAQIRATAGADPRYLIERIDIIG